MSVYNCIDRIFYVNLYKLNLPNVVIKMPVLIVCTKSTHKFPYVLCILDHKLNEKFRNCYTRSVENGTQTTTPITSLIRSICNMC